MRCVIVVLAVVLSLAHVCLAQRYVPTKARIVVRDDAGKPVANATVDGGFGDVSNSGARDRFKGVTDTNGVLIAKGKALLDVGGRITADGYYPTITIVPLDSSKRDSLKRWDVEMPVILKRIRNPIPMIVREVGNKYIGPWEGVGKYRLKGDASYDFLKGDFLPPNGKGEVPDIDYKWRMTIYSKDSDGLANDRDTLCEIRMTNVVDGICKGIPDGGKGDRGNEGSAFMSAYDVPIDGYTNTISFFRKVRDSNAESNDDKHYLYYFRIRTQTNEMGQVTNALYGKIHGQINGRFTYFLNPTPNDRNVESDREKNLAK